MSEARYAILIASSSFPDEPKLQPLRCPEQDVDGLASILSSDQLGDFARVTVLKNRPHSEVLAEVSELFDEAGKDGLVLFYYSGHGRQDREGQLYLATSNTKIKTTHSLAVSSIPVETLKKVITESDTTKVAIILDCCYSGAIEAAFLRGNADAELQRMSGIRGTYILTASTALQAAIEKEGDEYGVLTKHIIEGIRDGGADRDHDGLISMEDLYQYVSERVPLESPQEPMKWALNIRGRSLVIARAGLTAQKRAHIVTLLQEANEFALNGHWEEVLVCVSKIEALDANHGSALALLREAKRQIEAASLYDEGVSQVNAKRWAAALDYFEKIRRLVGDYKDVSVLINTAESGAVRERIRNLYGEAKIALSQGEWEVAVTRLKVILSIDPTHRDASAMLARVAHERELANLYREGNALYTAGEWSKALNCFRRIQGNAPDYKGTNALIDDLANKVAEETSKREAHIRATAHHAREIVSSVSASRDPDDWLNAVEELSLLIKNNPHHKEAEATLADALSRLGEIELDKIFAQARAAGERYYEQRQWKKAFLRFLTVRDALGLIDNVSYRITELAGRIMQSFVLEVGATFAGATISLASLVSLLWWSPRLSMKLIAGLCIASVVLVVTVRHLHNLIRLSDNLWRETISTGQVATNIAGATAHGSGSGNDSHDPRERLAQRLRSLHRIDSERRIDLEFVTCAEYQLFVDAMFVQGRVYQPDHWMGTTHRPGKANCPVTGVTAKDAADFCAWLTQNGDGSVVYRLPSVKEAVHGLRGESGIGAWCQDKNRYRLAGMSIPIKRLIHNWLRDLQAIVPMPAALKRNLVIRRSMGKAANLIPVALTKALGLGLDPAAHLAADFASAVALELKPEFALSSAKDIGFAIDLQIAPALLANNAETISPFATAFSQGDANKATELFGSAIVSSRPRLASTAALGLNLLELSTTRGPWAGRISQRTLAIRVLENVYRGCKLLIRDLKKPRDVRSWWQRLIQPDTEFRKQRRELIRKHNAISEYYWWLRVITEREAGGLPAWEGIRIVEELKIRY